MSPRGRRRVLSVRPARPGTRDRPGLDAGEIEFPDRPDQRFHGEKAVLEIEGPSGRVGRIDTVDKDLGLVRVCAADEDGGGSSRPAGLDDIQARNVFEGIGQRPLLLALNFLVGDHRDTAAHFALRRRQAGRRDDHGRQRDGLRQRVAVGRARRIYAMG
jgi:hypothetical protein